LTKGCSLNKLLAPLEFFNDVFFLEGPSKLRVSKDPWVLRR